MSHYGTLPEADAYHAARGRADWVEGNQDARTAALVRGSDYVDQRYTAADCPATFPGRRAGGRSQEREWPRDGVVDREGSAVDPAVVPPEVVRASFEAAYREFKAPGSLSPDYVATEQVTREKVGAIETSYATGGDQPNRPVVPAIDEILAGLLFRRCGVGVRVV